MADLGPHKEDIMCGYSLTGQKIGGGEYLAKARPFSVKIYLSCAGLSFWLRGD
jgi:hypothetical protein